MMKLRSLLMLSLCLGLLLSPLVVRCEEDETDEGVVEEEGVAGEESEEEGAENPLKNVSPDAETTILFTNPTIRTSVAELPAGRLVEFLVGFTNKGDSDLMVESLDASFRYPMEFKYHIQNFSAISYQKTVKPKTEATVAYSFIPADAFAGRPIGLTINLAYRDLQGNSYLDPVFNETVQIVEFDEGFDSEVFFMYLFLIAGCILLLFLVFSFLQSKASKKKSPAARPVETGTSNDDVDYEWIPKSTLRTPKSTKTSPRQRKSNKSAGSDTD
uniref:Translocon-associated protein subunit alpha n=1 Tax=Lepeophtheirus salmonis TaxID=72036 RepID=D3PIC4_LEPSM|nr:Translocon-associated protein subunit alpha [Lepeophtheirus salmonis]